MIEVNITKQYKSIVAPCQFELPSFVVLTGKNGSGKTHLLEAISQKEYSEIKYNGNVISNIKYIAFNGLNPIIKEQGKSSDITAFIRKVWTELQKNLKEFPDNIKANSIIRNSFLRQ